MYLRTYQLMGANKRFFLKGAEVTTPISFQPIVWIQVHQAGQRFTISTHSCLRKMLFNRVLQRLPKPKSGTRSHHPNPFDPQTTKGWKAAVKVSDVCF